MPARRILLHSLLGASMLLPAWAHAAFAYSISINDPLATAVGFHAAIAANVDASLRTWGGHVSGLGDIAVQVDITAGVPRATGRSLATRPIGNNGTYNVFEQSMAYELRTGIDPNGAAPDVEIQLNPAYIANELWFDPDPMARVDPVAAGRTDAMSLLLHEVGHALAFNGWGDAFTGALPGDYASTFDELTAYDGAHLFFTGANAVSLYGARVPLTLGNHYHVGNASGFGSDLVNDLMTGVTLSRETRYAISTLDLAMLRDMGASVRYSSVNPVPEPATVALLLGGIALLALLSRRRPFSLKRGLATRPATARAINAALPRAINDARPAQSA